MFFIKAEHAMPLRYGIAIDKLCFPFAPAIASQAICTPIRNCPLSPHFIRCIPIRN
jgi:hypothetical protein